MYVSRLQLKNWRNFTAVDIALTQRVFILGNNGLGKSNLLDAFRFLYDIAKVKGGGLQEAIERRNGMKCIRSLFATSNPMVEIGIEVQSGSNGGESEKWSYLLALRQEQRGRIPRRTLVAREVVKKGGKTILEWPDKRDNDDPESLTQTALEQIQSNKPFRPLVEFLQGIEYLHIVPQMIRNAPDLQARVLPDDPYGQELLNQMRRLSEKSRRARLQTITKAIQTIKPQFSDFSFKHDEKTGHPHLQYRHQNWRKEGTLQNEQQLSDGELRLIGLLWALLANNQLLLLEEPEISFNEGIIRVLPNLFTKAVSSHKKRQQSQVIVSTHSAVLLDEESIAPEEIVYLSNDKGRTKVEIASDNPLFVGQFKAGLTAADVVLPSAQSQRKYLNLAN